MTRFGGAVLRQGTRQRGFLILEVVLEFLAIQLDERLPGLDVVAEIDEHTAHGAFGLRRNRDLIFRGQRAHYLNRAFRLFLAHRIGRHSPGGCFAPLRLGRLSLAAGSRQTNGNHDDKATNG